MEKFARHPLLMNKLVCDEKLVRDAQALMAGEVHDVMSKINIYHAVARIYNCIIDGTAKHKSKLLPESWKEIFLRAERVLRAWVANKRLNTGKNILQIEEDLT